MNKVLLLIVILAALVGVSIYVKKDRESVVNRGVSQGAELRERLIPDLQINGVKEIRIKTGTEAATVKMDGEKWVVAERDGYPASFDKVRRALLDLSEQKISNKRVIGESAWSSIKVDLPEEGNEDSGKLVELMGEGGEVAHSLVLGDTVNTSGGRSSASPFGGGSSERFVRIPDDGNTIWGVNNAFYEFESSPELWLDKDFVKVKDLKSIEVKHADAEESWKAERKDEGGEFALAGAKEGESLDTSKVTLDSLLTSPTFNDVAGSSKAGELLKDGAEATLTTFEDFTYVMKVAKRDVDGSSKYHLSLKVSAKIPGKREPEEGESEEDKKKNDETFASEKKTLEEKLANEKAMEGWVYEVSEYTVNNLLKKRSEVVAAAGEAEEAAGTDAPTGASVPMRPAAPPQAGGAAPGSAPISVTTPPVAVPPLPKTEVKPAPDADANPAVSEAPKAE